MIGIDASAKIDATREQVERIARNTAALIGLGRELRDDEITVLDGWAGDFYGIPVQSTLDAITLTGRLEGMIIDPVYEGKSMAGLIDLVRSGDIGKDSACCTCTWAAARAERLQRHLPLNVLVARLRVGVAPSNRREEDNAGRGEGQLLR